MARARALLFAPTPWWTSRWSMPEASRCTPPTSRRACLASMLHFDAHADTGDIEFGSLSGHGQPMRRLIESGALRGDRFLQIGLRGYWPPPETWTGWPPRDAFLRHERD